MSALARLHRALESIDDALPRSVPLMLADLDYRYSHAMRVTLRRLALAIALALILDWSVLSFVRLIEDASQEGTSNADAIVSSPATPAG